MLGHHPRAISIRRQVLIELQKTKLATCENWGLSQESMLFQRKASLIMARMV